MNPVPGLTHQWYRKVNPVILTLGILTAVDGVGFYYLWNYGLRKTTV
jgi:hypothetical protein